MANPVILPHHLTKIWSLKNEYPGKAIFSINHSELISHDSNIVNKNFIGAERLLTIHAFHQFISTPGSCIAAPQIVLSAHKIKFATDVKSIKIYAPLSLSITTNELEIGSNISFLSEPRTMTIKCQKLILHKLCDTEEFPLFDQLQEICKSSNPDIKIVKDFD